MSESPAWMRLAVALAGKLGESVVDRAAELLERRGLEAALDAEAVLLLGLSAQAAQRWSTFVEAALADPTRPSATTVAAALRAAALATAKARAEGLTELLWTGPEGGDASLRRIDQSFVELVDAAKAELLIVTYSASGVPELLQALRRAVDRGVRVTFVKDFEKTDQSQDPATALGSAASGARVLTWPLASRPVVGSWTALLHAKCAVADESHLLLSSANVSASAFARNMELGLLVRGGPLPPRVRRHFHALADSGVLRPSV